MQKNSDAKMIGAFVLGGIILLIGGIIAFTSAELFSRRMHFVMYFDTSLNGLSIGSPVSFRGVNIGEVTNIVLEVSETHHQVMTPVNVEIDPKRFKVSSFTDQFSLLAETPMKKMIEKGLRAQLQTQSWITGQMFIELSFRPSFPARLRADKKRGIDEIPTIPSQFDQVQATLQNVLDKVRKLELQELVDTAVSTLKTAHSATYEFYDVTHKINLQLDSILTNVDGVSAEGKARLVEMRATLKQLNQAMENASKMFASVDREVATVSPALNEGVNNANLAFDEFAAAMRALKELAEYLERNPDALLTGKQNRR